MSYKKSCKIKFKNDLYQIIIRSDKQKGYLKIDNDGELSLPSAIEYLKINGLVTKNGLRF